MPNSIVVSRGCPHVCDFCYKEAFFEGGKSFYTQTVDAALAEIDRLPGRHLYFLDDHLFGDRRFASALFDGMRGMGRLWQAAGTVNSVLAPGLLEKAVDAGLRSLFVGFETLNPDNLAEQRKCQNCGRDYAAAVRRLHDLGVMVNGSFVFGMDDDDPEVFDRTVEWAIEQGIETATFHILTPYPGTALYKRMAAQGRITESDWDLYDTRHAVFQPARMTGRRSSSRATGRRTGTSTDGAHLARRGRERQRRCPGCGTSPTRPAGRSSSRCGTWSSARSGPARCCPCWRPSSASSANGPPASGRASLDAPQGNGTLQWPRVFRPASGNGCYPVGPCQRSLRNANPPHPRHDYSPKAESPAAVRAGPSTLTFADSVMSQAGFSVPHRISRVSDDRPGTCTARR